MTNIIMVTICIVLLLLSICGIFAKYHILSRINALYMKIKNNHNYFNNKESYNNCEQIDNKDIFFQINNINANNTDKKNDSKLEELDDKIECQCCYETVDVTDIIPCENNCNIFCSTCTKQNIKISIEERKLILCMNKKCGGGYNNKYIQIITTADEYAKISENQLSLEILNLSKTLDDYYVCPLCKRYGVIIENNYFSSKKNKYQDIKKHVECQNCNKKWCFNCNFEANEGHKCYTIQNKDEDKIKKRVIETIDKGIIHNCPCCGTTYNKEEGCNHIICPTCKTKSCYQCGADISSEGYDHFNRSKCNIYNIGGHDGNMEYNRKRVVNELKKILKNTPNRKTRKAIKKEIIKQGYTEVNTRKICRIS